MVFLIATVAKYTIHRRKVKIFLSVHQIFSHRFKQIISKEVISAIAYRTKAVFPVAAYGLQSMRQAGNHPHFRDTLLLFQMPCCCRL